MIGELKWLQWSQQCNSSNIVLNPLSTHVLLLGIYSYSNFYAMSLLYKSYVPGYMWPEIKKKILCKGWNTGQTIR